MRNNRDLRHALLFSVETAPTSSIYTLSLHDALPISLSGPDATPRPRASARARLRSATSRDRKSTRLNSSHGYISYAVFCLKKKTKLLHSCVTSKILQERTMILPSFSVGHRLLREKLL